MENNLQTPNPPDPDMENRALTPNPPEQHVENRAQTPDPPEQDQAEVAKQAVLKYLEKTIKFQRKWRVITMTLYIALSIIGVSCSGLATVLGAMSDNFYAGLFAGIATLVITVEKTLLFREKWQLHVTVATQLEGLRLDLITNSSTLKDVLDATKKVTEQYASELPVLPRD